MDCCPFLVFVNNDNTANVVELVLDVRGNVNAGIAIRSEFPGRLSCEKVEQFQVSLVQGKHNCWADAKLDSLSGRVLQISCPSALARTPEPKLLRQSM